MSPGCGEPQSRSRPMARKEMSPKDQSLRLVLVADNHQTNASNQRKRAKNGRKRNGLLFFRSRFDRSDVDYFLTGCIRDPLISEREDREDNQNNSDKDRWFHHGVSYLTLRVWLVS